MAEKYEIATRIKQFERRLLSVIDDSDENKRRCHIMNGNNRENIRPGARVLIVQKQDQRTEKLTEGIVKDILTSSPTHPHGIKVRLTDGIVGRVKQIFP